MQHRRATGDFLLTGKIIAILAIGCRPYAQPEGTIDYPNGMPRMVPIDLSELALSGNLPLEISPLRHFLSSASRQLVTKWSPKGAGSVSRSALAVQISAANCRSEQRGIRPFAVLWSYRSGNRSQSVPPAR